MYLSDNAKVSENLRRVIDNAFHTHHPFKYSSGQLEDFILVFEEIRRLPAVDFALCYQAIEEVLNQQRGCMGCYGKGLAYLKKLAEGVDDNRFQSASDQYKAFSTARDWSSDFEQDLLKKMANVMGSAGRLRQSL